MNKTKLFQELSLPALKFDEIEYRLSANLDNSTKDQIVFYKLQGNQRSMESFEKRLQSASPALLIIQGEYQQKLKFPIVCLREKNFQDVQEKLVNVFYPVPSNITLSGITGTNGKSTCVHLCAQISQQMKKNSYSLGTLGLRDANGVELDSVGLTTPSFIDLRRMLFELSLKEAESYVYLEVSSHALHQERIKGLSFKSIGWTNFTQDHLDYHQGLDEYFQAKCLIKNYSSSPILYPSQEIDLKSRLENEKKVSSLGVDRLDISDCKRFGRVFEISYNRDNLSLSLSIVEKALGIRVDLQQISNLELPPGRMTSFEVSERLIIVDYAHTPDAISSLLKGVKESMPNSSLTIVFGCGGDRDRSKRPLMRKAAEETADKCIITSDNPRSEVPEKIIEEIMEGSQVEHLCVVDRRQAIMTAFHQSKPGDVILIAGKGHEDYQEIKTGKVPYSDSKVVSELLGERND